MNSAGFLMKSGGRSGFWSTVRARSRQSSLGIYHGIVLPDISEYRSAPDRLKGIRCIHTHLKAEPLSHDDLTDLSLLRLDLMAVLTLTPDGKPLAVHGGTHPAICICNCSISHSTVFSGRPAGYGLSESHSGH